jgi:helix-turn-helix protein
MIVESGNRYLTPREAGELIGVLPRTLADWRRAGKGPRYSRPNGGTRIRYKMADIDVFMSGTFTSTTDESETTGKVRPCPLKPAPRGPRGARKGPLPDSQRGNGAGTGPESTVGRRNAPDGGELGSAPDAPLSEPEGGV